MQRQTGFRHDKIVILPTEKVFHALKIQQYLVTLNANNLCIGTVKITKIGGRDKDEICVGCGLVVALFIFYDFSPCGNSTSNADFTLPITYKGE